MDANAHSRKESHRCLLAPRIAKKLIMTNRIIASTTMAALRVVANRKKSEASLTTRGVVDQRKWQKS